MNLAARVHSVVAAEPAMSGGQVASTARQSLVVRRLWQGAAGAAVAAGVAAVSVFWLRSQAPLAPETLVAQTPAAESVVAQDTSGPDRYVVPATVESRAIVPTTELANYVVAHSEYSAPLSRRNLLSSLVASEAGTAQASDESEEAIAADKAPDPHAQDPQ